MAHSDVRTYLGVDLGGTKIAVSLWEERAGAAPARLDRREWQTFPTGPEPNIIEMVTRSKELLRSCHRSPGGLTSIGISGGGPLDPVKGVILSVPNLPGWIDVPIARRLEDDLGAPASLENDANAGAVAEWVHGAGRGSSHLAFLTCSTGIGAGLILEGRLYRGPRQLAGEAGHQVIVPDGLLCGCGKRGCLEAYASGAGMAARLRPLHAANPTLPTTAREVVEAARRGDRFATEFLRETVEYLAQGLANLVFLLDLDRIVLGTIPTAAGEIFFAPLRVALKARLWPSFQSGLEIRPSELWPNLGDYAALTVARDLPRLAAK